MASTQNASLPVSLGPLDLTGLEVPDFYDRGGTVQPVVHRLVGGGRVVQLLGADPGRRRLQGRFTGPLASERAQRLEAMRDSGERMALTIGAWQELVVVTTVILRYAAQGTVIEYLLEAEAVPDDTGGTAGPAALLALVAGQLAAASGDAVLSGVAAAALPLAGAASTVAAAQRTMSLPAIDLSGAGQAFDAAADMSGSALAGVAAAAPAGSFFADVGALTTAVASAGTLASSLRGSAFTRCAAANLSMFQTGALGWS